MLHTLSESRVDRSRLVRRLDAMAQVGALAGGGNSRIALTDADREGRDLLVHWMEDLDLSVSVDEIGNIMGTRPGKRHSPPVMVGSHIDTVGAGGRYDGVLGVAAGLEVVQILNDAGATTEHPVAIAAFTNEEGVRYTPDMMGSLVFAGGLSVAAARDSIGTDGTRLGDELTRIGYAGTAPSGTPSVRAFVELHVEQGPVLEAEGTTIGAVQRVQGISWTEFELRGAANHAGSTPMAMRHDAGYVASAIAAHVRELALRLGGAQVGTVGTIELSPNLPNVIPGTARVTVDLRNTDNATLAKAEADLAAHARSVAEHEGVSLASRQLVRFNPVDFAPELVDRVERMSRALGYSVRRMPSGAGHDAQMMARICPACMIFVPSIGGISHSPEERTEARDIEAGANVLLQVVLDLAG